MTLESDDKTFWGCICLVVGAVFYLAVRTPH